jgi:hypothetical protein
MVLTIKIQQTKPGIRIKYQLSTVVSRDGVLITEVKGVNLRALFRRVDVIRMLRYTYRYTFRRNMFTYPISLLLILYQHFSRKSNNHLI